MRGQILGGEPEYDDEVQDPWFHTEPPVPLSNTGPVLPTFPQAPQFFPGYDTSTSPADFLLGDWTSSMDTISGGSMAQSGANLYPGGPSYSFLAGVAATAQQQIATSASLEGSHVVVVRPVRGGEDSVGSHRQNFIQVSDIVLSNLPYEKANSRRLYKPLPLR